MMNKTTQRHVAVGVFTDHTQADRAVAELKKAGFRDDQIGVAGRDWRNKSTDKDASKSEESKAGEGAVAGVLTGAAGGALVGLGILAGIIPGIGPVIAGGALAAVLASAAGGAAIVGILGALIGLGIPEEEAHYYENEFKSGRTIITVKAEGRYDEAMSILRRCGGWDRSTMHETSATGTQHHAPTTGTSSAAAYSGTAGTSSSAAFAGTAGEKIEVKEEQLRAHKQPVQTGEVRVHKEVVTEHKTLDVPVQREEVVVERHAASGQAAHSDFRAGEEVRIPVMEEQVQVEKRPVVKEEVTVGKRKVEETKQVSGNVRKEEVRVEQEGHVDVQNKDKPGRR